MHLFAITSIRQLLPNHYAQIQILLSHTYIQMFFAPQIVLALYQIHLPYHGPRLRLVLMVSTFSSLRSVNHTVRAGSR
jgi:hypothetical protein